MNWKMNESLQVAGAYLKRFKGAWASSLNILMVEIVEKSGKICENNGGKRVLSILETPLCGNLKKITKITDVSHRWLLQESNIGNTNYVFYWNFNKKKEPPVQPLL